MKVRLAGHNLDFDLLQEIRAVLRTAAELPEEASDAVERLRGSAIDLLAKNNWTPETLSAAYARISRDPRPVDELRAIAREEVDAARRSNAKIIFGLGHASVAEHAVFNLDILGVSRLAVEEVERMRLCSYTEKSQRYILLDDDYVVAREVIDAGREEAFRALVAAQNALYREAYERLRPWVLESNPELAAEKKNLRMLEGLAKEDARYGLSLATTVQLGETLNARNLEALISRTAAHPLAELREFSQRVYEAVAGLAPSIVKYTSATPYRIAPRRVLREEAARAAQTQSTPEPAVLLHCPDDAEIRVVAALLHSFGDRDAAGCHAHARALGPEGRLRIVREALRNLGPHESILREFEHVTLQFEIVLSAACFGQLKRHRMATLTSQPYDPALGTTIPDSFVAIDLVERFESVRRHSEEIHADLLASAGAHAASYALLNAHRRRVLWSVNVRELYHFARLRLDPHAQWDIRRLAEQVVSLSVEQIPALLLLACGKDQFAGRYDALFDGEASASP